ncbi:30S ribosomal protein S21, partial [Dysosmobacter welbionis]
VGPVGGGLAGGDQLVGGSDGIVEHRRQLHQQIFRQGLHLRPVRDVGAHHQLHAGIRLAEAV